MVRHRDPVYVAPESECPHCKAPLLACNAEDGPFEVFKEDKKHEITGSETWACGTKRIGRCGYGEEYEYNRLMQVTRAKDCYAETEAKKDEELFWAKHNLQKAKEAAGQLETQLEEQKVKLLAAIDDKQVAIQERKHWRTRWIEFTGECDVCGHEVCRAEGDGWVCCKCGLELPAPTAVNVSKGEDDA